MKIARQITLTLSVVIRVMFQMPALGTSEEEYGEVSPSTEEFLEDMAGVLAASGLAYCLEFIKLIHSEYSQYDEIFQDKVVFVLDGMRKIAHLKTCWSRTKKEQKIPDPRIRSKKMSDMFTDGVQQEYTPTEYRTVTKSASPVCPFCGRPGRAFEVAGQSCGHKWVWYWKRIMAEEVT